DANKKAAGFSGLLHFRNSVRRSGGCRLIAFRTGGLARVQRRFQFHLQARLLAVREGLLRRLLHLHLRRLLLLRLLLRGMLLLLLRGALHRGHALGQHDAVVVLRMLQIVFRRDAIPGGIGIAGELAVTLENGAGAAPDLHIGTVGIEIPMGAATAIRIAMGTTALGTAATLTILVIH